MIGQSTFFVNPESGVEMARLIDLHQLMVQCMGHLFPQKVDISRIEQVLDLACGPGGWVQDVAFAHQDVEAIGVDSRRAMVDYARALARVQGLDNACFRQMDIRERLNFGENLFDFIQGRFLCAAFSPAVLPGLLCECKRILRPGGIICLIETGWPDTNSSAVQRLGQMVTQALCQARRRLSSDAQPLEVTTMLVPLLRDMEFQQIQSQVYEIPFTTGVIYSHPIMKLTRITLYLLEPLLCEQGVTSHEEFEALMRQMEFDVLGEHFRGNLCIAEAWGEKAG